MGIFSRPKAPTDWATATADLRDRLRAVDAEIGRLDAARRSVVVDAALGERGAADRLDELDGEHRAAARRRDDLALALEEAEREEAAATNSVAAAERARKVKALAGLHRQRNDHAKDLASAVRDMLKALRALNEDATAIVNGYAELTGRPPPADCAIYLGGIWPRMKIYAATIAPDISRAFGWHTGFSGALPDLVEAERQAARLYEVAR